MPIRVKSRRVAPSERMSPNCGLPRKGRLLINNLIKVLRMMILLSSHALLTMIVRLLDYISDNQVSHHNAVTEAGVCFRPCNPNSQAEFRGYSQVSIKQAKGHSLYQISSKMLHGLKVITLVEKKEKRWPGWDLNSRPPIQKSNVLTITPWKPS